MSMPVLKGLFGEKFHGVMIGLRLFRRWNDRIVEKNGQWLDVKKGNLSELDGPKKFPFNLKSKLERW